MVVRKREGPVSPDDWVRAALGVIARSGVAGVAVEFVAAELAATKGSFYWHFRNRDALVKAALDRWERGRTEAVIEKLDQEPDPLLMYCMYVGYLQMTHVAPHVISSDTRRRQVELVFDALAAGELPALKPLL